uniref:B-cell antigen receptor complex-associated protein alpha chain-like protein n=1 Tax=Callorhinchus milii TaxID=7868 RepID=V9L3M6_CALMI
MSRFPARVSLLFACFGVFSAVAAEGTANGTTCDPSVTHRAGEDVSLSCMLDCVPSCVWEKRELNRREWTRVRNTDNSSTADLHLGSMTSTHVAVYRCRVNHSVSCDVRLRLQNSLEPIWKMIAIDESTKNLILITEGILLLLCVVVPGSLLIHKKSKVSARERMKQKQMDNNNVYEGLNLDDMSVYEDITRGQQCMYQDVGMYRECGFQLETP